MSLFPTHYFVSVLTSHSKLLIPSQRLRLSARVMSRGINFTFMTSHTRDTVILFPWPLRNVSRTSVANCGLNKFKYIKIMNSISFLSISFTWFKYVFCLTQTKNKDNYLPLVKFLCICDTRMVKMLIFLFWELLTRKSFSVAQKGWSKSQNFVSYRIDFHIINILLTLQPVAITLICGPLHKQHYSSIVAKRILKAHPYCSRREWQLNTALCPLDPVIALHKLNGALLKKCRIVEHLALNEEKMNTSCFFNSEIETE